MTEPNKYILLLLIIFFTSCENVYQPKPKGFFRIDLPKKEYVKFENAYPYTFEYPKYSQVLADTETDAEPYWINIEFPKYRGTLHVSYKPVKNNLKTYLDDSRNFVMKHMSKANSIQEKVIANEKEKVYGLVYNITGSGTASTYQFYLTDSTSHFLRAALYFNFKPNNDSISPVIDFIKDDIDHMINTFKWK